MLQCYKGTVVEVVMVVVRWWWLRECAAVHRACVNRVSRALGPLMLCDFHGLADGVDGVDGEKQELSWFHMRGAYVCQ